MRHLYSTRVELLRLSRTMVDGTPTLNWERVDFIVDPYLNGPGELMCRLDLGFMRVGKDQPMPIVAGRAPDRVGVMVFDATDAVHAGDRIRVLSGPASGTFEIRVKPDPAGGFGPQAHHCEVQVIEVAQSSSSNLTTALDSEVTL